MNLQQLKEADQAPEFMTEDGYKTLINGYLLQGETPRGMYERIARAAADHLKRPDLTKKFFNVMWNNWVCMASPILSNMGTDRGLPISCYGLVVGDSLHNILEKNTETGMLSKYGGGVGIYMGQIRPRGSVIVSSGGTTGGVVAWAKIYDSAIVSCSQGGVRRGAAAVYLDIDHKDFHEFSDMRRTVGDMNTRCLNLHHGVCISDDFMAKIKEGHKESREKWTKLLSLRMETGEPYMAFMDTANKTAPHWIQKNDINIKAPQLCSEIFLPSDPQHTYVCCLASMNLAKWDEWKDTDAVEMAIYMLDAVMSEFIQKGKKLLGMENAIRFAEKSRALGLGALGWHTLLQQKHIPFDSFQSMSLNAQIFKTIKDKSYAASRTLAKEYGEPEWCKDYGIRNLTLNAVAPTTSNSLISGGVSQGIEPIVANVFVQNTAKGTFIRKNPQLQKLLESKGMDTDDVWSAINKDLGSVRNLSCLSPEEKEVFLTAREINQFAIVRQAGQRQKYIDQGQSVNLFFVANADPKYIHQVHLEAYELGLKSLYYLRSDSVIRADLASRSPDECKSCEG